MGRTVTLLAVALIVMGASALTSSAPQECELAKSFRSDNVRPTSRFEEFRIVLSGPDYTNADAVRRHFTLSMVWADALIAELAARSQNACEVQIDPTIFPDLRAFLVGYRSAKGRNDFFEAVCVPLLRDIVESWTPDQAEFATAVARLTRHSKWAKALPLSARNYPFDFTDDAFRSALARIYADNSVMHALVSVDTASYRALGIDALADWLGRQRTGQLDVGRLSICPTPPPRTSTGLPLPVYKKRIPVFTPSTTAPEGTMAILYGERGKGFPTAFQHVVIIGDTRPLIPTPYFGYSMSPYVAAVDRKYCGRQHMLDLGGSPTSPTFISASIKCQFATLLEFDDWMLLFCENCGSARATEAFAKLVANDPELRAIKSSETDMKSKGPYVVSFTASSKR